MTEEVLITIRGLHTVQSADGEEEIEVTYPGKYRRIGPTGILLYKEVTEEGSSDNMIKFREGSMELVKRGRIATHMLFECGKKTYTAYDTPFGTIDLGLSASSVEVWEQEKQISLMTRYALESNGMFLSESSISIKVCPRKTDSGEE